MSPPIFTPDGSEVSEIVLPDGSTASQVIGPDGNVVFEAASDIPDSGLLHRYEADNLSKSDGDSVSTWPDQKGTDDLTAGNAPTYLASAINGQPAVSYDFSDYLEVSFSTISTPLQHFLVAKLDSIDGGPEYLFDGGSNFENSVGIDNSSWLVTDVDTNFITGGTANTNWNQLDAAASSADYELSVNGTEVLNASDGASDQTGITHTARNGRSNTINDGDAKIAAHLVYDSAASGFNEGDVRDYLTDKYGPF